MPFNLKIHRTTSWFPGETSLFANDGAKKLYLESSTRSAEELPFVSQGAVMNEKLT